MKDVEWALRGLTANLMRVVRGAGKPDEIPMQAEAFLGAMEAHNEVTGYHPIGAQLAGLLAYDNELEPIGPVSSDDVQRDLANHSLIRSSLQLVASRLVRQPTQEARGRTELNTAVREIADMLAAEQKKKGIARKSREKQWSGWQVD